LYFKKLACLFVATTLLASTFLFGTVNAQQSSLVTEKAGLTSISLNQINDYPEVKEVITERGFDYIFDEKNESDEAVLEKYDLPTTVEPSTEVMQVVGEENIDRLSEKYGLVKPKTTIVDYKQNIIFDPQSIGTQSANIWYLIYLDTPASFTVQVTNIGTDPLDTIRGTLRKFNLNGQTFSQASSITFTKTEVNTGIVYNWVQPKDKVSDFFQYEITVSEDGSTLSYNNLGETLHTHVYQRYLFDAGSYSSLAALGGERHHFVSASALAGSGYNSNTAPAIRMTQKDHYQTPSWGSSTSAVDFRYNETILLGQRKFQELCQMEVNGLKAASDPDGKFSNLQEKYFDQVVYSLYLSEQYFGFVSQ